MIFGKKKPIEEPKAPLFEKELKEFIVKRNEAYYEINTLIGTVMDDRYVFGPDCIVSPSSYSLDKKRVFLFKKAYRGKTMNNDLAFYCSLELQKMIDGLLEDISKKKKYLKEEPTVESLHKLKESVIGIYFKLVSEGTVPAEVVNNDDAFQKYNTIKEIASEYMHKIRIRLGNIIDVLNKEKESIICFNDHVADLKSFKYFVEFLIN